MSALVAPVTIAVLLSRRSGLRRRHRRRCADRLAGCAGRARSRRDSCACCSPPTACRRRSCAPAIPTSGRSNGPSLRSCGAWAEDRPDDHAICYQSRATPQKWMEPSTEQEIERAAQRQGRRAGGADRLRLGTQRDPGRTRRGVPRLWPTGWACRAISACRPRASQAGFIAALAGLVRRTRRRGPGMCSHAGGRICPSGFRGCPLRAPVAGAGIAP